MLIIIIVAEVVVVIIMIIALVVKSSDLKASQSGSRTVLLGSLEGSLYIYIYILIKSRTGGVDLGLRV